MNAIYFGFGIAAIVSIIALAIVRPQMFAANCSQDFNSINGNRPLICVSRTGS